METQPEVGLLSHQRSKRSHCDYSDSGLDFPLLDKIVIRHVRAIRFFIPDSGGLQVEPAPDSGGLQVEPAPENWTPYPIPR